jgi:hypothetical protein
MIASNSSLMFRAVSPSFHSSKHFGNNTEIKRLIIFVIGFICCLKSSAQMTFASNWGSKSGNRSKTLRLVKTVLIPA